MIRVDRLRHARGGLALLLFLGGCGYHTLQSADVPDEARLSVVVLREAIADSTAADEVAAGVREELAESGALRTGGRYPRIEIEVLRTDERSALMSNEANTPRARGVDIALMGRAWLMRSPEGPPERDTGDVRVSDVVSQDTSREATTRELLNRDATMRGLGRRLGRTLAARVLGHPVAPDEFAAP